MPARNQTPPWSSFPVETHDPMISLWADLLRRWLASRALQEETPHDHLAQDRAAPLAAASPRLWALVHKSVKLLKCLRIYKTCILAKPLISLTVYGNYA